MATILNLRVTLDKHGLKDFYYPDIYEAFNLHAGQKVQFDDDTNELLVRVPGSSDIRRVKMEKHDVEAFTEYIF